MCEPLFAAPSVAVRLLAVLECECLSELLRVALVVVHAPDVGLHVAVAAGVVHRTCAVHSLCYVVYVLYEVCVYARVVGVPCLVERSPCDERRVVAVALHELCPFREEVARCQFVVHVESPACRFAPCKVSQLVSPVVITLLEALLVQARAVETGFFSKLDVLLESLV